MAERVLDVRELRVRFDTRRGPVRAVDGVSLHLESEETVGLVGESGSGKSVTLAAVLGLPKSVAAVDGGVIEFEGRDLLQLPARELRALRGNRIGLVPQDPMTALHPLLTVERQLTEVLERHLGLSRREARRIAAQGLGDVGIADPEARLASYPHQLSGGMRQRVMIAMALLCKPALLLADEPTTALDVTIQAQILDLLAELRRRHGTAVLLVTHDLGVVAGQADRVLVMYAGRLVETAGTRQLFARPHHPYTRGLLASVPRLGDDPTRTLPAIEGTPPDLAELGPGCAFAPRCAHVVARCDRERPPLAPILEIDPLESAELDRPGGESARVACFESQRVVANDPRPERVATPEARHSARAFEDPWGEDA